MQRRKRKWKNPQKNPHSNRRITKTKNERPWQFAEGVFMHKKKLTR